MRFNLIREPAPLAGSRQENPADLLKSYRQQNIMMQKIRVLHTAFDGIKLTNWSDSNRELPNILVGSVCEFGGRLFETTDNIILTDKDGSAGNRYIRLEIVRKNPTSDSDNDYLIAEVVSSGIPEYDYYNRGFYTKENDLIKYKYLRVSMKYNKTLGGYVEKKYWNISDLMRAGITFKKHSVSFGVGEHEFEVPDSANTITVHLVSGGGGGSTSGIYERLISYSTNGGKSEISINGKVITTCSGGERGFFNGFTPSGGGGGKASGQGRLIDGMNGQISDKGNNAGILNNITLASGGNGGNGAKNASFYSVGGGSGSAAIVEITRAMLDGSKKITIVVGAKGQRQIVSNLNQIAFDGQDGSAVVEYFTRG